MKVIWKISAVVLCLIVSLSVSAKSPVWKVTKGSNSVYIGGTVHVLGQSDYPLPKAFDKAYNSAQVLVLETDMSQLQTMAFQQKMLAKMTFQDGKTYPDVLSPKVVTRLNAFLEGRGLPIANLQTFKPPLLAVTLTMVELQRLGIASTGVDEFYHLRGVNDAKKFLYLETPDEQLDYIANMSAGSDDEFIEYTLNDIGKLDETMTEMKLAWRTGDNNALYDTGAKEWHDKFPDSYNQMIVKRNLNWMSHLEQYFTTKDVELVLVGALHLVGEDGVLSMLEAKGYTVTQL